MSEQELDKEKEIQRIAHHLWVLAKKPGGGSEQFLVEAEQIVKKRGGYRLDSIQDALRRHKNGDLPPSAAGDKLRT
jgi:hypothetical protein